KRRCGSFAIQSERMGNRLRRRAILRLAVGWSPEQGGGNSGACEAEVKLKRAVLESSKIHQAVQCLGVDGVLSVGRGRDCDRGTLRGEGDGSDGGDVEFLARRQTSLNIIAEITVHLDRGGKCIR